MKNRYINRYSILVFILLSLLVSYYTPSFISYLFASEYENFPKVVTNKSEAVKQMALVEKAVGDIKSEKENNKNKPKESNLPAGLLGKALYQHFLVISYLGFSDKKTYEWYEKNHFEESDAKEIVKYAELDASFGDFILNLFSSDLEQCSKSEECQILYFNRNNSLETEMFSELDSKPKYQNYINRLTFLKILGKYVDAKTGAEYEKLYTLKLADAAFYLYSSYSKEKVLSLLEQIAIYDQYDDLLSFQYAAKILVSEASYIFSKDADERFYNITMRYCNYASNCNNYDNVWVLGLASGAEKQENYAQALNYYQIAGDEKQITIIRSKITAKEKEQRTQEKYNEFQREVEKINQK